MVDIISRHIIPHGGWWFQAGPYVIRGETYDDLRANVDAHYRNNHIEIGNVDQTIQKQIADRNPFLMLSK